MSIDILNQEWNISKVKNKVPVRLLKSRGVKFSNTSNYYVIPDVSYFQFKDRIFEKSELPSWDARKLQDLNGDTPCVMLSTFWEEAQSLMDTPTEELLVIYNNMLNMSADLTEMSLLSMYNAKEIFTTCKANVEKDLSLEFKDFYNKYNENYIVKIAGMRSHRNEIVTHYRKKFNSTEMQWNLIPYAENNPIWDCMGEYYDIITKYPEIHIVAGTNEYHSILRKINIGNRINSIADLLWDYNLGSAVACNCIFSLCASLLTEYKVKYGIKPPSRIHITSSFEHLENVLIHCIKAIIEVKALEKNQDKVDELILLQEKLEILLCLRVATKIPSYWSINALVEDIQNNHVKFMVIHHLYK